MTDRTIGSTWRSCVRAAARRLLGRRRRALLSGRIALRAGETLGRDAGRTPLALTVVEGSVWATRSGDRRDHLLRSGATLEVPRQARLVVQALASSSIVIRRMPPTHRRREC